MAKLKLSALVSEMSGKLNGSVFSKNRGGAYLRTKVTPVNPSTSAQVAVRASLASLAAGFKSLTASQIQGWNAKVNEWARTNIFGDLKNPSGINLYVKLNQNLSLLGLTNISDAPSPVDAGVVFEPAPAADVSSTSFDIAYTSKTTTSDQTIIVEATPMVSPGVNFVKNKFRKIHQVSGGVVGDIDIYATYTARFGALVAGQKVFVRLKSIDNATGSAGQYTVGECVINA